MGHNHNTKIVFVISKNNFGNIVFSFFLVLIKQVGKVAEIVPGRFQHVFGVLESCYPNYLSHASIFGSLERVYNHWEPDLESRLDALPVRSYFLFFKTVERNTKRDHF